MTYVIPLLHTINFMCYCVNIDYAITGIYCTLYCQSVLPKSTFKQLSSILSGYQLGSLAILTKGIVWRFNLFIDNLCNLYCILYHVSKNFSNWLWPSDAIRRHRSGSILAEVMVCYLMAPSHYLNQCWLSISKVLCHSAEGIMIRSDDTNQQNKIENCIFNISSRYLRD